MEESIVEESIVEEPIVEESIVEEPIVEESIVEESIVEEKQSDNDEEEFTIVTKFVKNKFAEKPDVEETFHFFSSEESDEEKSDEEKSDEETDNEESIKETDKKSDNESNKKLTKKMKKKLQQKIKKTQNKITKLIEDKINEKETEYLNHVKKSDIKSMIMPFDNLFQYEFQFGELLIVYKKNLDDTVFNVLNNHPVNVEVTSNAINVKMTQQLNLTRLAIKELLTESLKGNPAAYYLLGKCFEAGHYMRLNIKSAFNNYKIAAEKNYIPAIYQLGLFCSNGYGCVKNIYEGIRLLKIAAEYGYNQAYYVLAVYYYRGYGVKKDYKQALNYHLLAARNNHIKSQFYMGIIHYEYTRNILKHLKVKQNVKEAYKWFQIVDDNYSFSFDRNLSNTNSYYNYLFEYSQFFENGFDEELNSVVKKANFYVKLIEKEHPDIKKEYDDLKQSISSNNLNDIDLC